MRKLTVRPSQRWRSGWIASGLAAVAIVAQMIGCGPSDASAPARETIVVYTAIETEQIPGYLAAFGEAHPEIEVELVRDSTGIVTAKLLAEADHPRADVVWGLAATSLLLADQRGLLEPYDPAGVERLTPAFRDRRSPAHWVGNCAWMTAFCANRIELERLGLEPPRSYADLVKPAYRGRLVMPHPASSGTGFLTVSAVLQLFGEQEGWAYLDRLHENMLFYTHSGSKPAKLAGQGEVPVGISFGFRGFMQQSKGEPIEVLFPAEGSGWDLEANALVRKPVIKDAAKRFLDWAVSPEAMRLYSRTYAVLSDPSAESTPPGFPPDPREQLIENDFEWVAANRERILDEWNRRYNAKAEPRTP